MLWFFFAYYTLDRSTGKPVISYLTLFSLIFLLGIYVLIIFNFFLKHFNLKVKVRWFFYYFLASATIILLTEIVPFLDKIEFNGLFAFLLVASCGTSFIFSLYFGIKTLFDKKISRK